MDTVNFVCVTVPFVSKRDDIFSHAAHQKSYTTKFRHKRPARLPIILRASVVPTLPLGAPRAARLPAPISYARVLEQTADAIKSLCKSASTPPSTRLTVDFPPERSETRAGTLVSRFENNLNFLSLLSEQLGCPVGSEQMQRVGPDVEIRDNVNPQGGGEYLTDDECMVGLRLLNAPEVDNRTVTLLLNTGVDAKTLKQVRDFDTTDDGVIVLVNCHLERVSWFAKIGFAKYIDSFVPAYYLKAIAPGGWLLKTGEAPWTVYVNSAQDPVVLEQYENRPSLVDVEAKIRLALADTS